MKKKFLNYRHLKREFQTLEERCMTLRRKLKYEKNDIARAEYQALRDILELRRERVLREECEIERMIADIPDSLTRLVFTLRYIEGLSWQGVAFRTGSTADGLRVMHDRYIKCEGGDMSDVS